MTYPIMKRVSVVAWPSAFVFPVGTGWAILVAFVMFVAVCWHALR